MSKTIIHWSEGVCTRGHHYSNDVHNVNCKHCVLRIQKNLGAIGSRSIDLSKIDKTMEDHSVKLAHFKGGGKLRSLIWWPWKGWFEVITEEGRSMTRFLEEAKKRYER